MFTTPPRQTAHDYPSRRDKADEIKPSLLKTDDATKKSAVDNHTEAQTAKNFATIVPSGFRCKRISDLFHVRDSENSPLRRNHQQDHGLNN